MASESTNGEVAAVGLSDDLDAWLDERADELGLERETLLQRLLASYRVAVTADEHGEDLGARSAAIEDRLDRLERGYQDGLEDVRKRVLQLKRATEANADADHHHEELDRVAELDEQVSTLADHVEQLAGRTGALAAREPGDAVTREEFQDTREKLSRVARAVVALRRQADRAATTDDEPGDEPDGDLAAEQSASEPSTATHAVDEEAAERLLDIKRTAAREGYERARCGACGEQSYVNLLPEPACPACGTQVYDIVEQGSFRKKATLVGDGGGE